MSPELAKHLQEIVRGNNISAKLWGDDDELFDDVDSLCAIVVSHLASAHEASFRRDRSLLDTHLRHARGGLILAIQMFNSIPQRDEPEKPDAGDGEAKTKTEAGAESKPRGRAPDAR